MPRRMDHYNVSAWQPYLILAAIGALVILLGVIFLGIQLKFSIRDRKKRKDTSGDPWNGRTLEWSTTSPPPPYNFAILPKVTSLDAFWKMKLKGRAHPHIDEIHDISLPGPTSMPILFAVLVFIFGFSMVWNIGWLAILSLLSGFTLLVTHTSEETPEQIYTVEEIKRRQGI